MNRSMTPANRSQADGRKSMNIKTSTFRALLVLASLAAPALATATDAASAPATDAASAPTSSTDIGVALAGRQGAEYTDSGADTCLGCHDKDDFPDRGLSFDAIFKGPHGRRHDPRAPFGPGGLQCEACHGPGGSHVAKHSKKKLTIDNFNASSFYTAAQRNQACLSCHENGPRMDWHTGAHERAGLACTDCHKLHQDRDPVLDRKTQADVCYRCHKQQRADFQKVSVHPVRFGKVTCSDCHNPHGSPNPAMLIGATVNQACYSCHAEKRGPLLWEHAPVTEDCTLCHVPHGSVRPALLSKTPPLLCQQCHTVAGHPSVAYTGASLPGGGAGASAFLLAGGCVNCHSQVHGSNHPAGEFLLR
jgi:DmsE family decaheme c-type cytochrome